MFVSSVMFFLFPFFKNNLIWWLQRSASIYPPFYFNQNRILNNLFKFQTQVITFYI